MSGKKLGQYVKSEKTLWFLEDRHFQWNAHDAWSNIGSPSHIMENFLVLFESLIVILMPIRLRQNVFLIMSWITLKLGHVRSKSGSQG